MITINPSTKRECISWQKIWWPHQCVLKRQSYTPFLSWELIRLCFNSGPSFVCNSNNEHHGARSFLLLFILAINSHKKMVVATNVCLDPCWLHKVGLKWNTSFPQKLSQGVCCFDYLIHVGYWLFKLWFWCEALYQIKFRKVLCTLIYFLSLWQSSGTTLYKVLCAKISWWRFFPHPQQCFVSMHLTWCSVKS